MNDPESIASKPQSEPSPSSTPTPTPTPPRFGGLLTGLSLVMFIEGLSSSSITVQIAVVGREFAAEPVMLQLMASAFLIAYAAMLLPAGRLVDCWDRRLIFATGLAAFAAGTILAALSTDAVTMVLARTIQGGGAALTTPAALAIITGILPPGPRRNGAVAAYGAFGAAGFSLGLVVPGLIVTHIGWRPSFLMLLPCILLVVLLCLRLCTMTSLAAVRKPAAAPRPDWWGSAAVLVLIGVGAYLLGAQSSVGAEGSLGTGGTLGCLVLVLVAGIVVIARRRSVFPDGLLRNPAVVRSALSLSAAFGGVMAAIFLLTLVLQDIVGLSAATVGLLILPQPLVFSLASRLGSAWVSRSGTTVPMTIGMVVLTVSLAGLGLTVEVPPAGLVVAAMAGVGLGLALTYPSALISALDSVPDATRGTVAGFLAATQNLGSVLGIAIVTALSLLPHPNGTVNLRTGMICCALMVFLGVVACVYSRSLEHLEGR